MTLSAQEQGSEVPPVSHGTSPRERIVTADLIRDYNSLFADFRKSVDTLMRPYFPTDFSTDLSEWRVFHYAPLDLIDEGDHYRVQVELPGLSKEDVDVTLNNESLSIHGERKEEEGKTFLHRERLYLFKRSVTFPDEVDPNSVEASMQNGVLELKIRKKERRPEQVPRKIDIA